VSALLELPELGLYKPVECSLLRTHEPTPLRFVWHHILPETCGGRSTRDNLINVCDNCHIGIHAIMYAIVHKVPIPRSHSYAQYQIALRGIEQAVALGMQDRIPNEGAWFL
jgi:hypothetical protein